MKFTENGVETILSSEKDYKKELDAYLFDSTNAFNKIFGRTLDGNLYGLFDGYYPEIYDFKLSDYPEFVPQEREWYIKACQGNGDLQIIGPYIDYGTKEMNLTLCKLLSDKKSVLAFDFSIKDVQSFLDLLDNSNDYSTFVITDQGTVVASKDVCKVFSDGVKNSNVLEKYYDRENKRLTFDDNVTESFRLNGNQYFMFTKKISFGWYAVTIYDSFHFYMELMQVYISCIFAFVIIFLIIFFFAHLNEKRRISMNTAERRLGAMADMFLISYSINIKKNTYDVIKGDEAFSRYIEGMSSYSVAVQEISGRYIDGTSVASFMNFMEPKTLLERTRNTKIISEEVLIKIMGWCRLWYIRLDDDNYMFALDNINKQKRRESTLVKLSESDLMTGLLNHASGLEKIRQCIEEKKYGMFCLFDIDCFKKFNDHYGHVVGDEVIISLAGVIRDSFRDTDIKMRLGGDEFIVYVHGIEGRTQASKLINNFFSKVESIKISGQEELKITLSMGVAFYKKDSEITYEEIYRLADNATYMSKRVEGNAFTFA
ncbi:sensor domain-containing diguanylate cyclase [Treponema sp.]|uniref:sensor domain-containing diguanylate cyclase n=1 Tax=Treponema sp. TaxID=166 RepID=UPI0025DD28CC|nr:sensor domain-containing diguanylate cyclase [Treponema sp.]MCR5218714.1 sensor domain-containing diguanylate cyclase [Treponema sp.]